LALKSGDIARILKKGGGHTLLFAKRKCGSTKEECPPPNSMGVLQYAPTGERGNIETII